MTPPVDVPDPALPGSYLVRPLSDAYAPRRLYCDEATAREVAVSLSAYLDYAVRVEYQGAALIAEFRGGHEVPQFKEVPELTDEQRDVARQRLLDDVDEAQARERAAHRIDTAVPIPPRPFDEPKQMRPVAMLYATDDFEAWRGTKPAEGTRRQVILDTLLKQDVLSATEALEFADQVELALLEVGRVDALFGVEDHSCYFCPVEVRDLFAVAGNAVNAFEARGHSPVRFGRKMAELKRVLEGRRLDLDAHFDATGLTGLKPETPPPSWRGESSAEATPRSDDVGPRFERNDIVTGIGDLVPPMLVHTSEWNAAEGCWDVIVVHGNGAKGRYAEKVLTPYLDRLEALLKDRDGELREARSERDNLQVLVDAQRTMYAAFIEKMYRPQLIAPEGNVPAGTRELRVVLGADDSVAPQQVFVELEDQNGVSVGGFEFVNDDPAYPDRLSYVRIPYGRSDEWVRGLINEVTMRCIGGIDSAGIDRTLREYGVEVKHPADVDDAAAAAPVGGPMSDALEKAVKDDEGPGEPEPGEGPDPDDEDRETVGSFHVIVGPDEEPYVAIESICDVLDDVGANAVERDRRLRDRGMRVHFDEEPEGLLQRALCHLGVR